MSNLIFEAAREANKKIEKAANDCVKRIKKMNDDLKTVEGMIKEFESLK